MVVTATTSTKQLADGKWLASRTWGDGGRITAYGGSELEAIDNLYSILGFEAR